MGFPMTDGGPLFSLNDLGACLRRLRLKLFRDGAASQDIADNLKDRMLPFEESPCCEACGETAATEVAVARDGNRVVECQSCGLWYTSPRIAEEDWSRWLQQADSGRNVEFTENRLRHGVALSRNVPYAFSFWWRLARRRLQGLIRELTEHHGGPVSHLHDMGCGVGFLLKSAEDLGLSVSGNDLNAYAVQRMKELFNFQVFTGTLPGLLAQGMLEPGSRDIVTMTDVIEHTYHPLEDLRAAHTLLREGGILWVHTFFVDSDIFRRLGASWDMLLWNHVFHFSSSSLPAMIRQAAFEVVSVQLDQARGLIGVVARKGGR